jgi:hypothetical protein
MKCSGAAQILIFVELNKQPGFEPYNLSLLLLPDKIDLKVRNPFTTQQLQN